jgi:hypothetical protein
MVNRAHIELFEDWLDRMGIDIGVREWRDQAAELLGKSPRMCAYYREGRDIPRDTLYLMDALLQGYRPKHLAHK